MYINVKRQLVSRSLQQIFVSACKGTTWMQYFPNISLVTVPSPVQSHNALHMLDMVYLSWVQTFALASYACFIRSSPSSISGPNTP